jgi:hypothetical protein
MVIASEQPQDMTTLLSKSGHEILIRRAVESVYLKSYTPKPYNFSKLGDTPTIFNFVKSLAIYEKLEHAFFGTEDGIRKTIFGPTPFAYVVIASVDNIDLGFALYFFNYSTFLCQVCNSVKIIYYMLS